MRYQYGHSSQSSALVVGMDRIQLPYVSRNLEHVGALNYSTLSIWKDAGQGYRHFSVRVFVLYRVSYQSCKEVSDCIESTYSRVVTVP